MIISCHVNVQLIGAVEIIMESLPPKWLNFHHKKKKKNGKNGLLLCPNIWSLWLIEKEIYICQKHFDPGCTWKKYVEKSVPMNHQALAA